ncbi:FadR/GntR family transcriptional regulator [Nocardiopsis sp. NPDC006198]|uniref:FadR/GntR family transcriptional regulator n=1 Tax=Nocardiopsis sp. NPDC006198 TaxID=3154472 RepID=UPI0033BF123C
MSDGLVIPGDPGGDNDAASVTRKLIRLLSSGQVSPGQRLPAERVLADELGVNRPTVREAIRSLAFLGLVEVRRGSGTYYLGPSNDLLYRLFETGLITGERKARDMLQARAHLEVLLAGLAAEQANDNDVAVLADRLEQMRVSSPEGFPEADVRFHLAIAEAARNSTLRDMLRGLRTIMQHGWVGRTVQAAATIRIAYQDHVPIFEAIERRDPAAAREAMSQHMKGATSRLLSALEGQTD